MIKYLSITAFLVAMLFSACSRQGDPLAVDVSQVHIGDVKIHRYDLDLFRVDTGDLRDGLEALKGEYPFFLGTDLGDPGKLKEMEIYLSNPRNVDFYTACRKKFPEISGIEVSLTDAFRHMVYYFPGMKVPRVYTYISGGDYEHPVMLADSVLLIALDCFLGKDFKPYQSDGLPLYKAERMIPEQIVPECMRTMINAVFPADPSALTLLDQMIDLGKRQYLLNAFLPGVSDELRMEYSADQFQWIKKNESHVWAAIIENRMLYSSDSRINRVFLSDGPCTQEFGKDSPPRLGEWIGLQVIRSFTDRNSNITLRQLLSDKSAQQILVRSGYKPGR